jgi:hypothetical protein
MALNCGRSGNPERLSKEFGATFYLGNFGYSGSDGRGSSFDSFSERRAKIDVQRALIILFKHIYMYICVCVYI